ncbi:hypothetical protein ANO11243_081110 [Dothideomycetidae sp. 11243]|nr:hypothetical protein ANO11243_081110 [fungal sp. No.11243]
MSGGEESACEEVLGEKSVTALVSVVLDRTCWGSESEHNEAIQGIFQLSLAKVIDAGQDHVDWAIDDIILVSRAAPEQIKHLADSDALSILLECLDIRRPTDIRRGGLTAIKTLLDVTVIDGPTHLKSFIITNVRKRANHTYIVAFSAGAVLFPILPVPSAELFLTEGFLQGLMPKLQENFNESSERRSTKLQLSGLELLSAVCQDKACRAHVAKYCTVWLQDVAEGSPDPDCSAIAALVLAKTYQVQDDAVSPVEFRDAGHLASVLGNMLLNAERDVQLRSVVEGLSYVSMEPKVKESIADNPRLLQKLVMALQDKGDDKPLALGILTIFLSLVQHKPRQSEEQKRLGQLKAYAESSKPAPEDPLLDDQHVHSRCRKLRDAKGIPAIVARVKGASEQGLVAIVKILFNMSQDPANHGQMVQQGVISILVQIFDALGQRKDPDDSTEGLSLMAAHTLARILISVNPNHTFSASMPAVSALRPLASLLSLAESGAQDLLPTYDSLRAMTNLASMSEPSARDAIVRVSFTQIENLLLFQNPKVQQAATELVCNLMASSQTVALFADGSGPAKHRMHILLALTDVQSLPTRRAAGGALAMLTEWDAAVQAVLDRDIGVKLVLGLCRDSEGEECLHRGLAILANMTQTSGEIGVLAVAKIKAADGADVVKNALKRTRDTQILGLGVEVLKALA